MAKGGKILALLGGILVFIGTFGLSLFTSGSSYFYGIGLIYPFGNFIGLFAGNWINILIGIGVVLYLLAFVLILIGIKVRLLALIGSIFPLAMATFVLLGAFNLWTGAYFYIGNIIGGGGMPALVTQWIPLSFSQVVFNGIDLGTWVILLGAVLALISSFITREDY
ncbi:MAG: hypothetical protein JW776_04910 [Candidatus Lokiarchaeota archaeon]|nr:hypothetical protein [Candidatus Lokiarchaeota archaeon]